MINLIQAWLNRIRRKYSIEKVVIAVQCELRETERLIAECATAKKTRNFVRADQIRLQLLDRGVVIEDTATATVSREL